MDVIDMSAMLLVLQDKGVGRIGEDLFRESMPHDATRGILIYVLEPALIEPYVEPMRRGDIILVARHRTYDEARALACYASEVLLANGPFFGSTKFLNLRPEHEPLLYPQSDGDLIEAAVTLNFTCIVT